MKILPTHIEHATQQRGLAPKRVPTQHKRFQTLESSALKISKDRKPYPARASSDWKILHPQIPSPGKPRPTPSEKNPANLLPPKNRLLASTAFFRASR
jgi:hypothetical protein